MKGTSDPAKGFSLTAEEEGAIYVEAPVSLSASPLSFLSSTSFSFLAFSFFTLTNGFLDSLIT